MTSKILNFILQLIINLLYSQLWSLTHSVRTHKCTERVILQAEVSTRLAIMKFK